METSTSEKKTQEIPHFLNEIDLLFTLFYTTVNQCYLLKDLKLRHKSKQYFNRWIFEGKSLSNNLDRLIAALEKKNGEEERGVDYLNDQADYYWRLVNEANKCKNKNELLAIIMAYNNGNVEVKEKVPISLNEFLKKKYSDAKEMLEKFGHEDSKGRCAQSRIHLLDEIKTFIQQ